jgi:hypothetical protein
MKKLVLFRPMKIPGLRKKKPKNERSAPFDSCQGLHARLQGSLENDRERFAPLQSIRNFCRIWFASL